MSPNKFSIREMQPTDSDQVAELMREDQSSMITTHFLLDTYTVLTQGDMHTTVAMVAEVEGEDGLAGIATVSFGEVQFEGRVLPLASLDSWQVGQRFRNQGLASRLVQSTIDRARAEYGDDLVLRAGLAVSNDASRATANKWAREFVEPIDATIVRVRQRAPRPMAGISVRAAELGDYAQIVERQNDFYADYNLYAPLTEESLAASLRHAPSGEPIYHYLIAETSSGEILAGALLRQRGLLMVDKVNHLPLTLRLLNLVAHIIPPDQVLRGIGLETLWFTPDELAVGQHFIKMLCWQMRDNGSNITVTFDPRNPVAQLFRSKAPFQPRFQIAYAVHGPARMSSERLVATGTAR